MKQLALFIILLSLTSCNKKLQVFDYEVPTDVEVLTLPIEKDNIGKGILYSKLYSKVEYVQLEATEQSLIGIVSKLEITDGGDFIVFDALRGSVVRFNSKGRYICHIGKRGKGHGEYVAPSDVVYDKYRNSVIVLDGGTNKLIDYSLDGKVQSSTQLDFMPATLAVLDEDYLCLYMNHYEDLSVSPVGNNFKIINRKGCVMSEFMEYDATMQLFHPECSDVFFSSDSKTFFRQPFSSMVYSLDDVGSKSPTINPEFYIDFGEANIPNEWYQIDFVELLKNLSETEGIMYLMSANKVGNRLFLNVAKNRITCQYIMNLEDRSLDMSGSRGYNDMCGFVSSISLRKLKDNKCYYVIDPSQFNFYKEPIKDENAQFYTVDENFEPKEYIPTQKDRDLLNAIHDGDNPIIQVCTLKD